MIRKSDPATISPYLTDASNFSEGMASEVVIPDRRDELIEFLKSNREAITVAGAGTGLTGSRVPLGGVIVSLEKFHSLSHENEAIHVGPAVRLSEVQQALQGTGWFYPPNPTEALASIGGTVATNASGSRSYKWGATREYVEEVEVVLADGRWGRIGRGVSISEPLVLNEGPPVVFPEVNYVSPRIKNASGYFVQPGMDWVDLFVGSEGTLGLFTEIKLRLIPAPAAFFSAILFFEEDEKSWELVDEIRRSVDDKLAPCAIEYFDPHSLARLKPEFSGIPESAQAALFVEQDIPDSSAYDGYFETWYEFLDSRKVSLENSWFAQNEADLRKFHEFRHQLPLLINEENAQAGRTKMGTDMAVASDHFLDMMRFYKRTLEASAVPFVMFGHIGDNHLHINFLPNEEQKVLAKEIYGKLADRIFGWGGTISAEHGVGKLKKEFYHRMVGTEILDQLKSIKRALDPGGLLGNGNLL